MATARYTPPNDAHSLMNLNPLGSQYAIDYTHDTTGLISRFVDKMIFDASPQQFYDLKLLNSKPAEPVNSDEFFYYEMGYGRDALVVNGTSATVTNTTQVITVVDSSKVTKDMILTYPTNEKATVISVDSPTQITVRSMVGAGMVLPQVVATNLLAYHSPVESDGSTAITQYFRQGAIERYNYIQFLISGLRYDKVELIKAQKMGTTNHLDMEKQSWMKQFKIDYSNCYWNGTVGEVILSTGKKAKTAGGIYPTMIAASAPVTTGVTAATCGDALEELALSTEYNVYGATRFLYGTSRQLLKISKFYKKELVRYAPNDEWAKLNLMGVDIGSTKIVFVPMKRFEDTASFPITFQKKCFLVDQNSITRKTFVPSEYVVTEDRSSGVNMNAYKDTWMSADFSIAFNNPLGGGILEFAD